MDEKSICANVQKLTESLNGELKAVHELGLKITVHVVNALSGDRSKQIQIRVWRETNLLQVPSPSELGPDWRQWPTEAQIALRDHLRENYKQSPPGQLESERR